jgi:hypothetical protein
MELDTLSVITLAPMRSGELSISLSACDRRILICRRSLRALPAYSTIHPMRRPDSTWGRLESAPNAMLALLRRGLRAMGFGSVACRD